MKRLLNFILIGTTALAGDSRHLIVAVSPNLPEESRRELANSTAKLLYEGEAGTQVSVMDAGRIRDVATVTLTDSAPRLRQQRHAELIRHTFNYLKTNAGPCFNVPVVLDEISRQRHPAGTAVLLIGPGMYANPKEPTLDFRQGWPADGHLSAGRDRSVLSTVERAHRLDGLTIHWLVTDADGVLNESHRDGLGRFWSLYMATQGGTLAAFTPNPRTAFDSALSRRSAPAIPAKPNPQDTAVAMHKRQIDVPQASEHIHAVTNIVFKTNEITVTNYVDLVAPRIHPLVAPGNTGVGIAWAAAPGRSQAVDLDLYVWIPRDNAELYFAMPRSAHGKYFRDIRQSIPASGENWRALWEFVELEGDQLPPEIWINLYSGEGPVQGEVRVQHRGKEHRIAFAFPGISGNSGANRGTRASSSNWLRIDLTSLQ